MVFHQFFRYLNLKMSDKYLQVITHMKYFKYYCMYINIINESNKNQQKNINSYNIYVLKFNHLLIDFNNKNKT